MEHIIDESTTFIGETPPIHEVKTLINKVAPYDVPILITV
jgi:DNA-binding NtrC family response regulator